MASTKKLSLPKSVLDMKFMKKTKDRIENSKDLNNLYSDVITSDMRQASGNYIAESSFIYCADMVEGRLSFKGMNPEIERLMEQEKPKENIGDMQKDVSDEVLAESTKKISNYRKRRSNPNKYICKRKR